MLHLGHRLYFRAMGLVFVVCLSGAWSAGYASGGSTAVRLKFSAGLGFLSDAGGDLATVRTETKSWLSDYPFPYTDTFAWEELSKSVPEWKAEAILTFGRHFGLGLGLSRTVLSTAGDFSLAFDYYESRWFAISITDSFEFGQRFKASALGFQLNFYYFLPLGRFELYAFAGPGYYLGDLGHDYDESLSMRYVYSYYDPPDQYIHEIVEQRQTSDKATCRKLGFQTGIGLQFRITSHIFFGVEAMVRRVNFDDWKGMSSSSNQWTEKTFRESEGTWTTSTGGEVAAGEGSLWSFVDTVCEGYFDDFPTLLISDGQPEATYSRVARKAEINFHAVNVMLTLTFRF